MLSFKVTGTRRELTRAADEFNFQVADRSLERMEAGFALITAATPVDTGRAVGSWAMNFNGRFFDRDVSGSGNRSRLPREEYEGAAFITNGTPYIQVLNNEGTSSQARQYFVEEAILRTGLRGTIDSIYPLTADFAVTADTEFSQGRNFRRSFRAGIRGANV